MEKRNDNKGYTNRLINEISPYLLQHAHNPVDWHAWNEEVFEKAKEQDRPIFLSIGYSTCHWCHVMEEESFADQEVADLLNEVCIPVKVDREERPDIDMFYMNVCQSLTGMGGWPLSIFLTPDKKPFFASTYLPKDDRYGRVGLMTLLSRIQEIWAGDRERVEESAESIIQQLKSYTSKQEEGEFPGKLVIDEAFSSLLRTFDKECGGFGNAPKFPSAHHLFFLLRYWKRTGNEHALSMVEKTLTDIRLGGIFDHVGLGFHRYATDREWMVPHFEKMLYDQALLASAYVETFQATGDQFYEKTAKEICEYVLTRLQSEEGGFYSAEDADTEGVEGKFYLWSRAELRQILSREEYEFFTGAFDLIPMEGTAHAGDSDRDPMIIRAKKPLRETAEELQLSYDRAAGQWNSIRAKLFDIRSKRTNPFKDDKIVVDWNGLMIAALAKAYRVFHAPRYREAAEKALYCITNRCINNGGTLFHVRRDGVSMVDGNLTDYLFTAYALLELFKSTMEPDYLEKAVELSDTAYNLFWDRELGGFAFSVYDNSELYINERESFDLALPSGNSVAVEVFFTLGRLTGDPRYENIAFAVGRSLGRRIAATPTAHTFLLSAVESHTSDTKSQYEVVITGPKDGSRTEEILEYLFSSFMPSTLWVFRHRETMEKLDAVIPHLANYEISEEKTAVYVCRDQTCNTPVFDVDALKKLLG